MRILIMLLLAESSQRVRRAIRKKGEYCVILQTGYPEGDDGDVDWTTRLVCGQYILAGDVHSFGTVKALVAHLWTVEQLRASIADGKVMNADVYANFFFNIRAGTYSAGIYRLEGQIEGLDPKVAFIAPRHTEYFEAKDNILGETRGFNATAHGTHVFPSWNHQG